MAHSEAQRHTAQVIPFHIGPQLVGLEVTEISTEEFERIAALDAPRRCNTHGELVVFQVSPVPDAWQLLPID